MNMKKRFAALLLAAGMLCSTACSAKAQAEKQESSAPPAEELQQEDSLLNDTAQALLNMTEKPQWGSVGGDWTSFGLSRWGGKLPENWQEDYCKAVESYVQQCGGVLDERKYTEYSRTILALTAMGKDPADVGGYNLLAPLADFEQTTFQGMNGPVYALLALDSGNYELPENTAGTTQASRELYVDYILGKEAAAGGWSLAGGGAEVDLTAMALQALAKYQDREDVAAATERALAYLSAEQNEQGGFSSYGTDGSESVSQVIVALSELGISMEDERFVKNGRTLKDRLLDFRAEDGGFRHLPEDDSSNLLATEQAFYALVALDRAEKGEASLYRISQ